jgi:hypothetical protein
MEYGINKVINNPLVGGAWLQEATEPKVPIG